MTAIVDTSFLFALTDQSDRRFIQNVQRGDSERLEKLFELYTKMTAQPAAPKKASHRKPKGGK